MVKTDEAEVSPSGGSGKRKMVEAVLDADNFKRPCHGKNGMARRGRIWGVVVVGFGEWGASLAHGCW